MDDLVFISTHRVTHLFVDRHSKMRMVDAEGSYQKNPGERREIILDFDWDSGCRTH